MTLVCDTSVLINLERGNQPTIHFMENLSTMYPLLPRVTFITQFEFLYGLQERSIKNKQKALAFLNNFMVLLPSEKTAQILVDLKYKCEQKGITLPLADLLIASVVIENKMILVTTDPDFKQIEELKTIFVPSQ